MADKNIDKSLIEDFISGLYKVNDFITEFDPDIVIFPIRGAVPINDMLRIIDRNNILSRDTEYLYSSSSVYRVNDVIRDSFKNLLKEYHVPGEKIKILTIDEVVSGHSLAREAKYIRMGLLDYINSNPYLSEKNLEDIVLKSVAIVDTRYQKQGKPLQKGYLKMLKQDLVYEVPVRENIVMDKPQYCPVKMKRKDLHTYYPEMERFEVSIDYLNLLRYVASVVGENLKLVPLQNPEAVHSSERFVPEKYKSKSFDHKLNVV